MPPIRVILAEDHEMVRQGLRLLLEAQPGISIVAEAADGLTAVELAERLSPDILVVDIGLPGLNGIEVTRQVGHRCPGTRILVLSMHSNEAYVLNALRAGASAYVLKDFGSDDLVNAIREVMPGRPYLSSPLSARALQAYIDRAQAQTPQNSYDTLTSREREILQLTAEGRTAGAVAQRLCISARTVESHRANLMRKLCLHNHTELIRYALDHGLIAGSAPPAML